LGPPMPNFGDWKSRCSTAGPDVSVKLCVPRGSVASTETCQTLPAGAVSTVFDHLASRLASWSTTLLSGAPGTGVTTTIAAVGDGVGFAVGAGVATGATLAARTGVAAGVAAGAPAVQPVAMMPMAARAASAPRRRFL